MVHMYETSPPLTRSRTAERLEKFERDCIASPELDLEESVEGLTPARAALQQIQIVYPMAGSRAMQLGAAQMTRPRAMSPSSTRVELRKRFRRLDDNARSGGPRQEGKYNALPGAESGRFDAMDDEGILKVMHKIVAVPRGTVRGLELQEFVMASSRSLCSLQLSCRRMASVLSGIGVSLHKEMAARAATQIVPRDLSLRYPYTTQVREESVSSDQLRVLREAVSGMHAHCAGSCCAGRRNEFNRGHSAPRLLPAIRRSTLTAACPSGRLAFVATRERDHPELKPRAHNASIGSGSSQWIVQVSNNTNSSRSAAMEQCRVQIRDLDQFSAPQSMRSSPTGGAVAFIRALHAVTADETIPFSVVTVWDTARCREDSHGVSKVFEPPGEAETLGAINAQDAWWARREADGLEGLAVMWSTAYVHPMGSVVGASADNACYFICFYCTNEREEYEIDSYTGPFYGKAQTASPAMASQEVAILVRKAPMGNGPPTRCTMLHNIFDEAPAEISHVGAISPGCSTGIPAHPHDLATCPSAVALSPSGDCIVAIHRRYLRVMVEVLVRTAPTVFVSVQTIDVTHWATIGRAEPSVFDAAANGEVANALRLPYSIVFSPCGRFATLVDQRPLFGLTITNYGLVVLDMCHRLERRGVRALPLAPVEDVAPRSLEWTVGGMWIQPRFGALLLNSS